MLAPYLSQAKISPRVILEIGPGSGNLLYCMKKIYPDSTCIFVDLSSSLIFSIVNVLNKWPDAKFLLPNEVTAQSNLMSQDFLFLRDDQIDLIPSGSVDLMLNTVSFGEMGYSVIKKYFQLLRRVARSSNLFYCLNRVEKVMTYDGLVEPIRFHSYPWDNDDVDIFFRMSEIETPLMTLSAMFEKLCCLKTRDL
jgi:hypothetical protein